MKRRHALGWLAAWSALVKAQVAQAQSTRAPSAQAKKQNAAAAASPPAPPAPPPSSSASAADLGADIELVRETLNTLHPGVLRYNSQLQIDASMTALKRAFVSAPDSAQRFLVLSRFLAMLKCGHSHANFFNQSPAVAKELFDRRSRLPFTFRWIGDAMVVTGNAPNDLPPRGTVVTAINGTPAPRILEALLPHVRADGNNDAKRRSLLAVTAKSRLEAFDVFLGLLAGAPASGTIKLDLKLADGKTSRLEVPALTMAERDAQLPAAATAKDAPAWDWRIDEHGVALLTMPSWALYNSPWGWKAWLGDKLDGLAADTAAKGLVIDLRGNEGGLDCGNAVLERFVKVDSTLPVRRLVRFRRTPEALNKVLDSWEPSFRTLGEKAKAFDSRFFELPSAPNVLRPQGQRIELPLVVPTDAANSSATFTFAQRVKASRVGRLVGEPTGGNQRGINAGAFFFVRLPASGLEFDLPLIGSFALQPMPDAGIEPDVRVDTTAADIAAGRDAALERALALVRGA
jgi:Peptidase family S41